MTKITSKITTLGLHILTQIALLTMLIGMNSACACWLHQETPPTGADRYRL